MDKDLFADLRDKLLDLDPVSFIERRLTLDGNPFRLSAAGYRPFVDIYRYIGIKALEPTALPVVMVKGRQVGGTTMASALEMYFMGCGIFGVNGKPPMRVMHAFPHLESAGAYSKTKLNPMISGSVLDEEEVKASKGGKVKSYMQKLLDQNSSTTDSLSFKQFINDNHLWVDSTGVNADRLRGRTVDCILFDECFPYEQCVETINGKVKIGKLYKDFISGVELPLVKTFNEVDGVFEYKKITNAWKKGKKKLIKVTMGNRELKCTPNHKILTDCGWIRAGDLSVGNLIKTSDSNDLKIRSLNDDQLQIVLGSFLGDGHLASHKLNRYRLKVIHGEQQKDYCEWKASMFGADIKRVEENGYSKKPAYVFSSKCFALEDYFPNQKTSCPQWVLDNIDLRGIAIWLMDDASIGSEGERSSICLSTCSFDEDSQKRIVKKFESLGIDCHYSYYFNKNKDRGYYSIYFNKLASNKLLKLTSKFFHKNLSYKLPDFINEDNFSYNWSSVFNNYGLTVVDKISNIEKEQTVYDIEVEDNHNFIATSQKSSKNLGGPIVHNCQDIPGEALTNATKILAKSHYGKVGKGVQVYFGTPKKKGSDFYKMWEGSTQQYFHLGCEKCKKHFPLYTPGSDDWEKVWLHGFIVKCTHCNHEQHKDGAAERGKWVGIKPLEECSAVGFHINQLYMPGFSKETIMAEKPGTHPINTDRVYQNEVLGEFYQGDSSPITEEEIREACADVGRKQRSRIEREEGKIVVMGIDYGARSDIEQMANADKSKMAGQSYSTAVILTAQGPNLLSIEFATKFKKNDVESKKSIIDSMMRQYNVQLAVGDIGFSNDFSEIMHNIYGDRYLVSRAHNKINDKVKFNKDSFPKEITFERDYYLGEFFSLLKKGNIRFPYGDYDKISWLVAHCASMDIKPSISKYGDHTLHYVKGSVPNDGLMALLNAYLAYKFIVSKGFTTNNPMMMEQNAKDKNSKKPLIVLGKIDRKF